MEKWHELMEIQALIKTLFYIKLPCSASESKAEVQSGEEPKCSSLSHHLQIMASLRDPFFVKFWQFSTQEAVCFLSAPQPFSGNLNYLFHCEFCSASKSWKFFRVGKAWVFSVLTLEILKWKIICFLFSGNAKLLGLFIILYFADRFFISSWLSRLVHPFPFRKLCHGPSLTYRDVDVDGFAIPFTQTWSVTVYNIWQTPGIFQKGERQVGSV